ncbi:hypothetical protein [Aureivirga sp. CE67]|uniref:hypothetical protein n=1 Tax=Aureivirga sp. CE67 TaxID=1788983 RepID=UPI0018C90CCD|nr:hypothetical protein [Aureivirga sp. CE67]
MKTKLTLLLLFIFNLSFSQTKEEVMEAILEKDHLMYKSPDGFNNISDILKEKFSEEELFEFTTHEKSNLRLAAKLVLIEMNKGNVIDFLTSEIKTNEEIKYIDGAYVDNLNTVSLIYYFYTQNRIMKTLGYLGQKAAERLVFNSAEVKQMNKIIMDSEVALSAYVREKIFKYEKSDKN